MSKSRFLMLAVTFTTAPAIAQYDLRWNTIDGGGATFSTGGNFRLGGTIGQPDAGPSSPMTGGAFTLVGGFWPGAVGGACALPGDMNLDGQRDGLDVQSFVNCLLIGGACDCADVDASGVVDRADAVQFVQMLLS